MVAHRLTTAASAGRIVAMDHGHAAKTSTHDDLLALDGAYAGPQTAFISDTEHAAQAGGA